jgi:carboxyl-terminal processing protease
VFTEVLSLIQRSYVDDTSLDRLFAGALDGTTDALDPLATYVPASSVELFRQALEVGASHSGLTVARDSGISYIVAVEFGSPGADAGFEAGDILAKIGGSSTREMPLWRLQTWLAEGSGSFQIELLRRGNSLEIELPLGPYERVAPSVRLEEGVPVLRIVSFENDMVERVESLLDGVEVAESPRLVVDVRGVAGGSHEAALRVAAFFANGVLGELRIRGESIATYESDAEPRWLGRLALLADGGCQGPCEVFLAAVREISGADFVGRRTFGHAGRRTFRDLSTGATLFFADAFYSGPNGEVINQGLEPEVRVEANRQVLGGVPSDGGDPVLERALELLMEDERQAA